MKSSNDRPLSDAADLLVGEIVGVHGLNGTLKLRSYADSPTLFADGRIVKVENADGHSEQLSIAWAKPHGKGILLAITGITSRDMAEALIGSRLLIDKATLPDLDEGTYYWFELIGLSVYTPEGQYLGTLEKILPTGSNDVYVVRNGETEILVPALESVVQVIDTEQRRMEVDLPEGL